MKVGIGSSDSGRSRACVVGFGSIGKRHAEVLSGMLGLTVCILSRRPSIEDCAFPVFSSLDEVVAEFRPNYIVIANETHLHATTLESILKRSKFSGKILVEKPLFKDSSEWATKAELEVGVGYNLRFHPGVIELKKLIAKSKIVNASFVAGQWLPDWRPNTNYEQSYSAHRSQGGGVARDLSHEIDLCLMFCGKWESLTANLGKRSFLNIESEDVVDILIRTEMCSQVHIHINYLDRIPQRKIGVNTEEHTYVLDFIANRLTIDGQIHDEYNLERNSLYKSMHLDYLNSTGAAARFSDGLEVVGLIEAAESASREKRWVENCRS